MTPWLTAKLATRCTYPGCSAEPLDDHCQCARHAEDHRRRNRRWWTRRVAQLDLSSLGMTLDPIAR